MKYYIIAGEASGDLHGSNLIRALKKEQANATFRCWGGDLMKEAGGDLVKHYKDLDFMGFIEVIANLRTILKNIKFCKKDIKMHQPDAVILIDYPGFNLRIAEYVKSLGIKVFYYISPQVWAWNQKRAFKFKRLIDKMFVILPFEKAFYRKFDYEVEYVGHPLLDAIKKRDTSEARNKELRAELNLGSKPIVLLLPGSRKQEIKTILPIMLQQNDHFPDYQFVIAAAPSLDADFFDLYKAQHPELKVVGNRTYDLFQLASAALVTSGTATLETALFDVPEVVCYKGSFISYQIAKRLIKVNYISLVNLVMDSEVVKELIQNKLNKKLLKHELGKLLKDEEYRKQMLNNFDALKTKLGGGGASMRTAKLIAEATQK